MKGYVLLSQRIEAKFPDGVTLKWNISGTPESDATLAVGTHVGTAKNDFESFIVFKDSGNFMFTNADGYQCNKIYFVFH
jgi:hypothetical protein